MPDGINFDTSVLMDYLCLELDAAVRENRLSEGVSDDTAEILEDDNRQRVIGGKVEGEFIRLSDRHGAIYADLLQWLRENPDSDIYDYDVTARDVAHSDNDVTHVRFDVQCGWESDERRKQLSDFRRLSQDIDTVAEHVLYNLLDEVYEQFSNDELKTELTDSDLDLGHDRDVIVDAVEINDRDGIDILVSADGDLADDESGINDRIERIESTDGVLRIRNPDDF